MPEYLRPDVYIQRDRAGAEPIQAVGTSTAGFVGQAQRGKVGEAILVTSWTDYVNKFAKGMTSPFLAGIDLAYAVYGFFQNGGGRAFIVRACGTGATQASIMIPATTGVTFKAKDEGVWGNKLAIAVTVDTVDTTLVKELTVYYDNAVVEKYTGLSTSVDKDNYFLDVINSTSSFVVASVGGVLSTSTKISLAGGTAGSAIADTDYINGLKAFDVVDDVNLIAISGQTTKTVLQAVVDYCSNRGDCFAVLDAPLGTSTQSVLTFKADLASPYGAVYYPWGKVVDPKGKGALRLVPPSGHVMGIFARTDTTRGVHKAPAGVEATVKGFVETEFKLSNGDVDLLNQANVNCIVSKPNRGIVVWGARLLSPNLDRTYVSDMRFDIALEEALYKGTQWTIFEPNNDKLWGTVTGQIKSYMYNLWVEGALYGANPDEAYFIKCDAELNTEEVRNAGKLIIEVGYAKNKPAEFTVIRLTQKTNK